MRHRPLLATFVAVAAVLLSGCSAAQPSAPPSVAPTTEPLDPPPSQFPDGTLPTDVPMDVQPPAGFLSRWLLPDADDPRFEQLDDHTYPERRTISLYDTESGCFLWATVFVADAGADDLADSVSRLAGATGHDPGEDVTYETMWFGPNPIQGTSVEFVVAESLDPDGGTWAVRAFGSIGNAQTVQVTCETSEDELDYLESISTTVLVPDFFLVSDYL